jgi:accessory gene regulator protein AgrB
MGKSGMKRQTRHLIYLVTLIVLLVLHIRVNSSVLISYMMIGLMLLWQYNYLDPKTKTQDLFIQLKKRTLRK